MKTINPRGVMPGTMLIATAVASVLLAACAAAPVKPDGAAEARNKLTQLQSDPNLASRAPVAMKEADTAVRVAEQPQADQELGAYRVYLADRKVEIARAQAETSLAEDQRATLSAQREGARLDARTREADAAHVAAANSELAAASSEQAAANSRQQATELQRQIDVLQAKPTDRGLVLTLGDVLFENGRADLKAGATGNLNRLVAFLNEYPDRNVAIEGFTDSVGSEDYNQGLSERRADSVKSYLTGQGIGATRLSASGKGKNDPVASNDSAAGRQQNRRVEVIISNPPAASR
ncbi:MAG TPA: OmpA family protein [Steroidobacteraceae bacterium]|jgi:outer membrane protein OmpA-like peptidoglycan-associated protein|nr:OmpA family protein [Steroidobacteraceae bacterium]